MLFFPPTVHQLQPTKVFSCTSFLSLTTPYTPQFPACQVDFGHLRRKWSHFPRGIGHHSHRPDLDCHHRIVLEVPHKGSRYYNTTKRPKTALGWGSSLDRSDNIIPYRLSLSGFMHITLWFFPGGLHVHSAFFRFSQPSIILWKVINGNLQEKITCPFAEAPLKAFCGEHGLPRIGFRFN